MRCANTEGQCSGWPKSAPESLRPGRAPLHLKDLKVALAHRGELWARILQAFDRGKHGQAAFVRETVGKQLLEGRGRRCAAWLVAQQVFKGDFIGVHRIWVIGTKWHALMPHFRGRPPGQ